MTQDLPTYLLLILSAGLVGFCLGSWRARRRHEQDWARRDSEEQEQVARYEQLSARVLEQTQDSFFRLAKEQLGHQQALSSQDLGERQRAIESLVQPLAANLDKVQGRIQELEKHRVGAYEALRSQLGELKVGHQGLQQETARLVQALRRPSGRGQWGEVQLKRVVELAGMVEHCDFETQVQRQGSLGHQIRPDLLVNLPSGRCIVVDAKAPMEAYLSAHEARDEGQRDQLLAQHAKQVIAHLKQLGSKAYQSSFDNSVEFVVLFLPSEALFAAALEQEPGLIEHAVKQNVIPATPTTLIALLRTVAQGWREESLAEDAREIARLGQELYGRCAHLAGHFNRLGQSLEKSLDHYNKAVGSLESRVMVTARQLEQWQGQDQKNAIPELGPKTDIKSRQLKEND